MRRAGFLKRRNFKRLIKKSDDRLKILLRKDPTADSLASAYALMKIAEYFHISAICYYSGNVQHKVLLNIMGPNIKQLPEVIGDELSGTLALVDVVPSELTEGLSVMTGIPAIIISHSKMAVKDIKCKYKDIRADVETTSAIMVQHMRNFKVPMNNTIGTMLIFAIRDKTRTFLTNLNRNEMDAYHYVLRYIDHELLIKLEKPSVKSETFTDLTNAINNKTIKDAYLLTNTGYVKDPSTLPKVCKYMLDMEGISTALVFAVDTSNIYIYATTNNIEINLKKIFRKAFKHCGNIVGSSSYASITIPLGVFGIITEGINNDESKALMLKTIRESIYAKFLGTIEEGAENLDNE